MKAKAVEWFRIIKNGSGGFCFVPAFPTSDAPSSAAGHSAGAAGAGPELLSSPTPAGAGEAPVAHRAKLKKTR